MMQQAACQIEGLPRQVALGVRIELTRRESSVPKLVDAMPLDPQGRRYSYRRVARKLSGDAPMTLDDLEALCVALGVEPSDLIATGRTAAVPAA